MQTNRVIRPLIIMAFVAGALFLTAACGDGGGGTGMRQTSKLQVGDCYNGIAAAQEVEVVACDTPHDGEVVVLGQVAEKRDEALIVGGGGKDELADCLNVPVEEIDATLAERGLNWISVATGLRGYIVESKSGKLTAPVCGGS